MPAFFSASCAVFCWSVHIETSTAYTWSVLHCGGDHRSCASVPGVLPPAGSCGPCQPVLATEPEMAGLNPQHSSPGVRMSSHIDLPTGLYQCSGVRQLGQLLALLVADT
jgi:hypothetical protein